MAASSKIQAQAWQVVGQHFKTLGGHPRHRLEEVSTGAAAERRALEKSARQLVGAIEKGIGLAAPVAYDPQLKVDVARIGAAIRDAIGVTLAKPTATNATAAPGKGETKAATTKPKPARATKSTVKKTAKSAAPRTPQQVVK